MPANNCTWDYSHLRNELDAALRTSPVRFLGDAWMLARLVLLEPTLDDMLIDEEKPASSEAAREGAWLWTDGAQLPDHEPLHPSAVTSQPPRIRSSISAPGARRDTGAGLAETSKRALYLGFGSYIFDRERTHLVLSALDACRDLPFWRSHFVDSHGRYDPDSHRMFDAWYRDR